MPILILTDDEADALRRLLASQDDPQLAAVPDKLAKPQPDELMADTLMRAAHYSG